MLLQPVNDEAVGGEEAQNGAVFDGLKRANPGVEILLGELRLKIADAAIPKRYLGCQLSPQNTVEYSLLE